MTERPILFCGEMVRAILAGKKVVTRRVVKCTGRHRGELPRPASEKLVYWNGAAWDSDIAKRAKSDKRDYYEPLAKCPYGDVGDRLWVRETWRISTGHQRDHNALVSYKDGKSKLIYWQEGHQVHDLLGFIPKESKDALRWRSPLFMPRWASRITLEVTDVRVERLQDITEEDAALEGFTDDCDPFWKPTYYDPDSGGYPSCRRNFAATWDDLNGKKHPWASNCFVWRVAFRLLTADRN